MPAEQYISRSSLAFPERIELFFRESGFRRYTHSIDAFQKGADTVTEIHGLPETTGVTKEVLLAFLTTSLSNQGYNAKDLSKIDKVYRFADDKFQSTPGREKRSTGDDTITHALWMACLLAENGITDPDVQMATILHDVHEDTDTSLEEIERLTDRDTALLVDRVSKVKTQKIIEKEGVVDESKIKKQKEDDEKATLLKLLEALESDPRAFLIKAADVIHNQASSDPLPFELKTRKAKLAFEFYEPMLRGLGFEYLADMIGDFALRSVRKSTYEEILAARDAFYENIMPFYKDVIESLAEFGSHDGSLLECDYIGLESPSVYKIYEKAKGKETRPEHFLPRIQIIVQDEKELLHWHRYFNSQGSKTLMQEVDSTLNSGNSVIESVVYKDQGEAFGLEFELSTRRMTIQPADLFIDSIHLTPKEQTTASQKLYPILNSYRLALSDTEGQVNSVPEEMTEGVKRGFVNVLDKDENIKSIPLGSTALDLAYKIGRNLGNEAVGVHILRRNIQGAWESVEDASLGSTLQEGDRVIFDTKRGQIINPDRYDFITTEKAVSNSRNKIEKQILGWTRKRTVVQALAEGKVIKDFANLITQKNDKRDRRSEFVESAMKRGLNIIEQMYETTRGKKLDSHIIDVFSEEDELRSAFGNVDSLLANIGITPIPMTEQGGKERWLSDDQETHESVRYARHLVERLIDFRESRQIFTIVLGEDKSGVLEKIGNITKLTGVDVQIRSKPVNSLPGRATEIELVLTNGGIDESDKIAYALLQEFGEEVTIQRIIR
jgi:(p)ppGpp synthase/HD superfamily hydrolase